MKRILVGLITYLLILSANAQDALTVKDYANAEDKMGYNTQKFVDRAGVAPNWLPGDKFWYRVLTPTGSEFILVDPAKGTKTTAFDHEKLAAALSTASGRTIKGSMLPFQSINYSPDGKAIIFNADRKQWRYDLQTGSVTTDTTINNNTQRGQG